MKTDTWDSLCIFDKPLKPDQICFRESQLDFPKGIDELIRENWDKQLNDKQTQLLETGLKTEIRPYVTKGSETGLNALYENTRSVMWPGPVVILKDVVKDKNKFFLYVGQSYFPFINGLQDEHVEVLYLNQNITKPRPPLAICTFALTSDNLLTLTIRGKKTNMYPGRFYGQGGNPLYVNTDIIAHQVDEMHDEILIDPLELNTNTFRFLGIIVDQDELRNKPDLIGYVPVNLTSGDIVRRIEKRSLSERPGDALGVSFVPADAEKLLRYLKEAKLNSFCPPAHGGLVLYGYHRFGNNWIKEFLKGSNTMHLKLD